VGLYPRIRMPVRMYWRVGGCSYNDTHGLCSWCPSRLQARTPRLSVQPGGTCRVAGNVRQRELTSHHPRRAPNREGRRCTTSEHSEQNKRTSDAMEVAPPCNTLRRASVADECRPPPRMTPIWRRTLRDHDGETQRDASRGNNTIQSSKRTTSGHHPAPQVPALTTSRPTAAKKRGRLRTSQT